MTSGTPSDCGRFCVRGFQRIRVCAVAAIADVNASFASFLLISLTMIFSARGGCVWRPLTVNGANAARPAPFWRGTLEMPLPVPRDSAVVFFACHWVSALWLDSVGLDC